MRRALRAAVTGTLRDMETDGTAADAATFAAHLAAGDDPDERAEHLRRCRPCAEVTQGLRADPAVGPDLELRLLHAFREWRDT
jgi:hypothetical protein